MRASDLLARRVIDANGSPIGIVHDLRVMLPARAVDENSDSAGQPRAQDAPRLIALVVGPDGVRCRLAYAWGYAQGRSRGPAVFRALLAGQGKRTRTVPVTDVDSWDLEGRIRLRGAHR